MDLADAAGGHHDDDDLVHITLNTSGENDKQNLTCDDADDDPSWQIITTTTPSDTEYPPSNSHEQTTTGTSLEDPEKEEGAIKDNTDTTTNTKTEKKTKQKIKSPWAATKYTYRAPNGSRYNLSMSSPLAEEFRKLDTTQERRDFLVKHGTRIYPGELGIVCLFGREI